MIDWLVDQVIKLWNKITDVLTQAYNWAVGFAVSAFNSAVSFAQSLFNSLSSTITSVWNALVAAIVDVFNSAVAAAQALVNGVIDLAYALFNAAVAGAQALVNGVIDLAYALFNAAVAGAQALVNGVIDLALALFGQAVAAAQALVDGVVALFTALYEQAIAYVEELKAKIGIDSEEGELTLWSFVTDPFGTLIAYVTEFILELFFWLLAVAVASPDVDLGPPPDFLNLGSGGPIVTGPSPAPGGVLAPPVSPLYVSGYVFSPAHPGTDFGLVMLQPVFAAHEGTVRYSGPSSVGYGLYITIEGGDWWTLYGHNAELLVSAGQHVQAGQQIARGDSTGNSSGPHLHFVVKYRGTYVDPLSVL